MEKSMHNIVIWRNEVEGPKIYDTIEETFWLEANLTAFFYSLYRCDNMMCAVIDNKIVYYKGQQFRI